MEVAWRSGVFSGCFASHALTRPVVCTLCEESRWRQVRSLVEPRDDNGFVLDALHRALNSGGLVKWESGIRKRSFYALTGKVV